MFVLTVWIIYPAVYTIVRSFFGQQGYLGTWVGFANYKRIFTTHELLIAIRNNAIWVAVVPAFVTAFGLIFAVLTEQVRWSVAFKTVIFLPMAISAFATGVTWRIMYQQDPNLGAINALGKAARTSSPLPACFRAPPLDTRRDPEPRWPDPEDAAPSWRSRIDRADRDPADRVPSGAKQAVAPKPRPSDIVGTVWRDFKPGGGVPGKVEQGELGLPGVSVELDPERQVGAEDDDRRRRRVRVHEREAGDVPDRRGASTFAKPWAGYAWLGPA